MFCKIMYKCCSFVHSLPIQLSREQLFKVPTVHVARRKPHDTVSEIIQWVNMYEKLLVIELNVNKLLASILFKFVLA